MATMHKTFPGAVPEIPVSNMEAALDYYRNCLGFNVDWGGKDDGISGVSRGQCRMFLTDSAFRKGRANSPPVVTWLNLESKADVDAQHAEWQASGAAITAQPESKPWMLHEFAAVDLDGNVFRVFYEYSRDA
jgi:uncharacterized glyoxalase superfamily protein PhnB